MDIFNIKKNCIVQYIERMRKKGVTKITKTGKEELRIKIVQ